MNTRGLSVPFSAFCPKVINAMELGFENDSFIAGNGRGAGISCPLMSLVIMEGDVVEENEVSKMLDFCDGFELKTSSSNFPEVSVEEID